MMQRRRSGSGFGRSVAAEIPMQTTNFVMFDNRMVLVETITAELTITQQREIAQYGHVFDALAELAVVGDSARAVGSHD